VLPKSRAVVRHLPESQQNRRADGYSIHLGTIGASGSVVGGLTSGFMTWLSQRAQARAGQLAREMSRRDDLYNDFIVAASKHMAMPS
jgi:hypothetical protein